MASFYGKFSLTLDLWTSITTEPFIGVTCHFLDPNWNLKTICLDVVLIPYPHNATDIKEKLIEIL